MADASVLGRVLYEDAGVVVLAKDPGDDAEAFSEEVVRMEYVHVEDDDDTIRYHDFRAGVRALALPGNQSVLLVRERGHLWEDF